jgi:hypothetical protein
MFTGSTRAVVRSEAAKSLSVEFSGLPDGSTIEVQDPLGQSLTAKETQRTTSTVGGSGTLNFTINGAGVYIVSLSSTISRTINGAGTAQMSAEGKISVNVQ